LTLDRDDIAAICEALLPRIKAEIRAATNDDLRLQAEYLVTLPIDERKRRAREMMAAENRQKKLKGVSL